METNERVIFLDGPGLYFRPTQESDLPLCTKWINDPEIRVFISNYLPMTMLGEREWFNERHKKVATDISLVLVRKDGDRPIGTFGLHGINHRHGTATTGALIGEKDCWGKGFGTQAKMIILRYAFHTLNLRKIYSHVYASNGRSRRYSEKCGYTLEAILKKDMFIEGRYIDKLTLSVFRSGWEPLWGKFLKNNPQPW